MDNDFRWNWIPQISESYGNVIEMDTEKKTVAFFDRVSVCGIIVVRSECPMTDNHYHSWTIKVERSSDGNMFVGVATEKTDFTRLLRYGSWLGRDKESWVLSSWGRICHKNVAFVHAEYKFCQGDYITVYLDMINRTLMFAINRKLIGYQYVDVPNDVNLYPVIAASKSCEMRLIYAHTVQPSLLLLSLVAHTLVYCKSKSSKLTKRSPRLPRGSRFLWYGTIHLDGLNLPPGMARRLGTLYPTLISECPSSHKSHEKHLCPVPYAVPKVLKLENPIKLPSSRRIMKRITKPPKCCCKVHPCSHVDVFNFTKMRFKCESSSDDEIFPEITRKRKRELKKVAIAKL
ncbi:SPRY domain-containing SOCS box protein 3-like isoform X1 [Macrobrachium nipponense]|uniref:SPRY domain-containing SOCS box protein 3-like isoform X1 n=2 Tax=Macrobrachium nipponense TaxID=159736 RepID=UPI0030C8C6D1